MRTVVTSTLAVALLAAPASAAREAPGAAGGKAQLQLIGTAPVSVRGRAFRPSERVTLTVRLATDATWRQVKTASTTGAFTVVFAAAKAGHCTGFTVRAIGNAGSSAVLHRVPLPACMPE